MTIFGCCLSDSDAEPDREGNVVPIIHPTTRRAAVSGDTPTVADAGKNARTNDPEPGDSAGATHPSGVRIRRNANGGAQFHGDLERVTYENGFLRTTDNHGQVRALSGGDRPAQTGGNRRDRHDERGSTTRNHRPARGSRHDYRDTPKIESSSLEGSSTGLDGSTGSNQNAKTEQGHGVSDWASEARTLDGGDGPQDGAESGIGGSFGCSGWSSGYTSREPSSSKVPTTNTSNERHDFFGVHQNNHSGTHIQINGPVSNLYGSTRGLEIRGPVLNNHTRR
jgi:hypothetical protein